MAADAPRDPFPFSDRKAVLRLARDYWGLITAKEAETEGYLEAAMPEARHRGYLRRETFLRLAAWKSPRPTRFYKSNSSAKIRVSTQKAFLAESDRAAIAALSVPPHKLAGVALRTATAILHWMRPDEFPMLDVRIVKALGDDDGATNWENIDYYSSLAVKCRYYARKLRIDLRTLDRAMWAWDKEYSPRNRAH